MPSPSEPTQQTPAYAPRPPVDDLALPDSDDLLVDATDAWVEVESSFESALPAVAPPSIVPKTSYEDAPSLTPAKDDAELGFADGEASRDLVATDAAVPVTDRWSDDSPSRFDDALADALEHAEVTDGPGRVIEPAPFDPDVSEDATSIFAAELDVTPSFAPTPLSHLDVTPSFAPEPASVDEEVDEEPYVGDGPFAAPKDPRPKSVSSFAREMQPPPFESQSIERLRRERSRTVGLDTSIRMERRPSMSRATSVVDPPRASPPPKRTKKIERHYPKMRALLMNPDVVPEGNEPPFEPPKPPVPGTFFPAAREPLAQPAPADLDGLLATMAEGLLIGETAEGHTEVRVTLKDEFFAGTELRITLGDGAVTAVLVPPDREVYWQLAGNIDALRDRLTGRGLSVTDIRVADP